MIALRFRLKRSKGTYWSMKPFDLLASLAPNQIVWIDQLLPHGFSEYEP
jgi:hypothetical protein